MCLEDGTAIDLFFPLGYLLSTDVVEGRWVVVMVMVLVAVMMVMIVKIVAITSIDFVRCDELLAHDWVVVSGGVAPFTVVI